MRDLNFSSEMIMKELINNNEKDISQVLLEEIETNDETRKTAANCLVRIVGGETSQKELRTIINLFENKEEVSIPLSYCIHKISMYSPGKIITEEKDILRLIENDAIVNKNILDSMCYAYGWKK